MAATQYWGTARWGTTQSATYTGTASTATTAVKVGVYKLRIIVTTAAFVRVGDGAAATSADVYMAAGVPEYVSTRPGDKVTAVQVASGGSVYVTECS